MYLSHGETTGGKPPVEYACWQHMKQRCYDPNFPGYRHYGGRGITVDPRWLNDYPAFVRDMGRRPSPAHSIDRIDNDGPYSPENCRWATVREQGRNRRTTLALEFRGVTLCATEWSERLGGKRNLVGNRLKKGWPIERAVTELPGDPRTALPGNEARRERRRRLNGATCPL